MVRILTKIILCQPKLNYFPNVWIQWCHDFGCRAVCFFSTIHCEISMSLIWSRWTVSASDQYQRCFSVDLLFPLICSTHISRLFIAFGKYRAKVKCSVNKRTLIRTPPPKRRVVQNAFLMSQFSYYPFVWMCYSRSKNKNVFQEGNLWIIYKHSPFKLLLEKDKIALGKWNV